MLKIPRSAVRWTAAAWAGLCLAGTAEARPAAPSGPCRVSIAALETLVLEERLETVVQKLGCPGALRSVEALAENLRFQTRIWQVNVWPHGQFIGEFINGELHGMTNTVFMLSVTF